MVIGLAVLASAIVITPAMAKERTAIRGWTTEAASVAAGTPLTDRIRIRSGDQWRKRTVSLWSKADGSDSFSRVWRGKSKPSGRTTITIPTSSASTGEYRVRVESTKRYAAKRSATRSVTVTSPTPAPNPEPTPYPTPTTTTVYVTGDIGWSGGGQSETGEQLRAVSNDVLLTGDITYSNGTEAEYATNFTPYFGDFKDRSWPVPGNHDYGTGWPYYLTYWGDRVGSYSEPWYAKRFGDWLFLMLDSNCTVNTGCGTTSPQYLWAKSQLESFSGTCVAAVWHHPRWSTSQHGNNASVSDLFALLREHNVEMLLAGHDHVYERFLPSSASGTYDSEGVAEFVVGTGGASLYSFPTSSTLTANTSDASYGVLKLDLNASGYAWQFLPTSGTFTDSGTANCH